jgi:membrane protein YdbS with pleckstrin-like domain
MPLITCPDCGREVSSAAAACPQCGRPMTPSMSAPPPQPPGKEETLWHGTPSWFLLLGKILGAAIVTIVLVVILYFGSDFIAPHAQIAWLVVVAVVIWMFVTVLIALVRIKTTIYTVTTQRIIIETGIATKSVEDIDLRYVDDTQFQQSFFQRLLGIGSVTIISSDKVAPNYMLYGVPDPRGLRELIRANAYQVSQRQLFTRAT